MKEGSAQVEILGHYGLANSLAVLVGGAEEETQLCLHRTGLNVL